MPLRERWTRSLVRLFEEKSGSLTDRPFVFLRSAAGVGGEAGKEGAVRDDAGFRVGGGGGRSEK